MNMAANDSKRSRTYCAGEILPDDGYVISRSHNTGEEVLLHTQCGEQRVEFRPAPTCRRASPTNTLNDEDLDSWSHPSADTDAKPSNESAAYLYGGQTARSMCHFNIGLPTDRMPSAMIKALALLKKACATVNKQFGLDTQVPDAIGQACDEVAAGKFDDRFPLSVWQSGSGTQSNMNVDEVVSTRASEILREQMGSKKRVHPNDLVHMSRSSSDTFATAMHIATLLELNQRLHPALKHLHDALKKKSDEFAPIYNIRHTHLQDAVPMMLSQEDCGSTHQVAMHIERLQTSERRLYKLAIGGKVVGTGISTAEGFGKLVADELKKLTNLPFVDALNKLNALSTHNTMLELSDALNTLAVCLMRTADEIRLMSSRPRCGIGELVLSENEPGRSIMPGTVNSTQCEVMTMVAVQVMGNHTTVSMGGGMGHFELNLFQPLIIKNVLHSIRILSDVCRSFTDHCIVGIEPNTPVLTQYMRDVTQAGDGTQPSHRLRQDRTDHDQGTQGRHNAARVGTGVLSPDRRAVREAGQQEGHGLKR